MKKYFAPRIEIYNYKLAEDVLSASAGSYDGFKDSGFDNKDSYFEPWV